MKNIKLKTKLLVIVLVSIIPMVLLNCLIITSQYERTVEQELKSNQEYAEAIGTAYMNYINSIWGKERAIGQALLRNKSLNTEYINDYLADLTSDQQIGHAYVWVNLDGIVIASNKPETIGVNVSDRDYYQRVMNGEEKVVSNLMVGKATKQVSISVARGIKENGQLKGIIAKLLVADKIGIILPENRIGKTSTFGLIDRNGMIVFRNGTPNIPIDNRRINNDSPGWKALRGEVGLYRNYNQSFDGISSIGASTPIFEVGWGAFASTETEEVYEEINAQIIPNVIAMLLMILISIITALYFIVDLLKAIRSLEYAANAISRSDFSIRTNMQRKDELGQTGKAFDKMAEHIQEIEARRMIFLQTAAHELRNPMTSVKGISSIIYRSVNSGKPLNNIVQLIETLNHEVCRLADLLNQILEAFCAERQNVQIKTNMQSIDITKVLSSAVKLYQVDTTNNRRIISNSNTSIWVLGDYHRLEDVVRNLLSNAVKYSSENTEVYVNAYYEDGFAVVSVRDEGIGIPKDHLTQIFNSFHRINTDANSPGGLGLGLYICKDIVTRHGGKIWAENNEDKGCTFYFNLPISDCDSAS